MAMSITKFEVHSDGVVSINLTEMPRDAKIDNTTIYIGGTAQPEPEKVSAREQIIQFTPSANQQGVISVTILKESGSQETATSGEVYKSRGSTSDETSLNPNVTGLVPPKAKPGQQVRLRGSRMNMVDTIWLGISKLPGKPRTTSTTASFRIPDTFKAGQYKIGYKGPNMTRKMTSLTLEVEAKAD